MSAPFIMRPDAASVFGYEPHDMQRRFVLSNAKRILACWGRGSGKSLASDTRVIRVATLEENAGLPGAILAPTYKQLKRIHERNLRRLFKAFLHETGVDLVKRYWAGELRWELHNGAEIWLLSYDRVENLRGYTLAWAAVDELSSVSDESAVTSVLNPAVRGEGSNHIWHTLTPRGRRGIVAQYVDNVAENVPGFQVLHMRSDEAPHVDPQTLALTRAEMGKAEARQELDAVLLKPSNVVFSEFSKARHLIDFKHNGEPYSVACDWGDSHPAYLWIAHARVAGVDVDIVFDEFVEDDVPWDESKALIVERCKKLGREPDVVSGDRAVREMMSWASWAFPKSQIKRMESRDEQSIWTGVQVVKRRLDPEDGIPRLYVARHLDSANPRRVVGAFGQYRRAEVDGSPIDRPLKDNVTDHVMDALRYLEVALHGRLRSNFSVVDNRGRGRSVFDRAARQ